MKRLLLTLLCLFLLPAAAMTDEYVWVAELKHESYPLTNRIVFIIDVSGSMRGDPIRIACKTVLEKMAESEDKAFVKIYVFNDTCWSLGDEWLRLPDKDLVDRVASERLLDLSGEGNTDIGGAIKIAITQNMEPDACFVLLTDGEPTGPEGAHYEQIALAQADRTDAGANEAVINVIGIRALRSTAHASAMELFQHIARANRGSCLVISKRRLPKRDAQIDSSEKPW